MLRWIAAGAMANAVMAAPVSAQLDDGVWEQAALSIEQDGNALSGPGADWLRTEMAGAQSVLVCEQHGVDGLARFTAALEAEFQPDVLVLEAGPWIGDLISADGVREALAFAPYSLAFDYDGDIALIEQFQARTSERGYVIGVDQESNAIHPLDWFAERAAKGTSPMRGEIMPGASWIARGYTEVRAANERRIMRGLHLKAALDAGEYLRTRQRESFSLLGNLGSLSDLDTRALSLQINLGISSDIFRTWRAGDRRQAAERREAYMIQQLEIGFRRSEILTGLEPDRRLFKMGGAHIMEGETGPNGVKTLGEYVQRLANQDGQTALHLGVRGFNPETTPYPIASLIEGRSILLLDTSVLRAGLEAGQIEAPGADERADIYGYDALVYLNPLQSASKAEIRALQAQFRSRLYTRLGTSFWPAPVVAILSLVGIGALVFQRRRYKDQPHHPLYMLSMSSAVTSVVFGWQVFALISTAPMAAGLGPALLSWLAPILALFSVARLVRQRSAISRRFLIIGALWAALLLWLALGMYHWNFGGMLA